jgi:hypothetical protein
MLSQFQRDAIVSEIREIFVRNNDGIPANAYIENLWQEMSTSHLYMALGNFRRMAEREE